MTVGAGAPAHSLDGTLPRRDLWKQRVGGTENTGRAAALPCFTTLAISVER